MVPVRAVIALVVSGRTGEAAALVNHYTTEQPERRIVRGYRALINMLRGDLALAADDMAVFRDGRVTLVEGGVLAAGWSAELALWAGQPADALGHVRRGLALFKVPDMTFWCGWLLTAGMRACADLAEQARARR